MRLATRNDIDGMHRVRMSVRENRLTSRTLGLDDYISAIEITGRGWVIDVQDEIVAFAIGDAHTGSIWALFVHPAHERKGYGRQLHDAVVQWLWAQGHSRLWLTTEPHTRAQRFYEAAGWRRIRETNADRYELIRPHNRGAER